MSDRDQAVLAAINEHFRKYGVAPTIRYIVDTTEIQSTSLVHNHYQNLIKAEKIIMCGSPGSKPKPVPIPLLNTIKESLK